MPFELLYLCDWSLQLVGPTPLPSAASSPLTGALLLAATEGSEPVNGGSSCFGGGGAGADVGPCPLEVAETIPVLSVTTHAATEADQQVEATSGKRRYGPSDFELLGVVGQGAFGKVGSWGCGWWGPGGGRCCGA